MSYFVSLNIFEDVIDAAWWGTWSQFWLLIFDWISLLSMSLAWRCFSHIFWSKTFRLLKLSLTSRLLSHIEHHSFAAKAEDEILCAHCLSQLNISFIRLSENTVRYVVSNYLGLYFIQLKILISWNSRKAVHEKP